MQINWPTCCQARPASARRRQAPKYLSAHAGPHRRGRSHLSRLILHKTGPRAEAEEWVQRFNEITMSTARIRSTRQARPARPAAPPLPSFEKLDETHRVIVQVLAELERLVDLLKHPGQAANAALLARHACTFFNTTARQHHEAEETFVFPKLLQGGETAMRAHVNRLQQDHNWLEEDWLEPTASTGRGPGLPQRTRALCAMRCPSSRRSTTSTLRWRKTPSTPRRGAAGPGWIAPPEARIHNSRRRRYKERSLIPSLRARSARLPPWA